VRVTHRDVKSANVLLDRGCHDRIGDFGFDRSLNDNNTGITVTHMQTDRVESWAHRCAWRSSPEYMRGEVSMKVDAFASGLIIVEALTGLPVCSPSPGHRDLLSMFEENNTSSPVNITLLDR
jgi:interleukin-1 receptor-associated kinase 4